MNEHYSARGSFIASKLFQKLLIQLASSGKLIHSNNELIGDFKCTERGLQYAFDRLEEYDLFNRTYANENKTKRTGIDANIENILELLSLRVKDVEHLERGNLKKSIITQIVITIKKDRRALKAQLTRAKNLKDRERFQELKAEMQRQDDEFNEMVTRVVERHNSYKDIITEHDLNEAIDVVYNTLLTWGLNPKPPGSATN